MKTKIIMALIVAMLCGCATGDRKGKVAERFADEVRLSYTPVKDQGSSSLCWAYAMLATIETEHIMRGDSVNLSPTYVARTLMMEQADKCYLSKGKNAIHMRGMMPQLIRLIQTYGLMPYDSYHSNANMNVAARKLRAMIKASAARACGMERMRKGAADLLDNCINPLPLHVYMYSMEYTPIEFAHSVCMPEEYQAITSFTHLPMNRKVVLDVPDNHDNDRFINIPIDKMMRIMERSVRMGHPVCWEGDVSENGFSFKRGIADTEKWQRGCGKSLRQREFESFRTTDDHCMAIIGIAHDKDGRKFFVCKNSWGTENPYGGLMYMSFDYARLKTVAIMVNSMAL